jgi:hypothetical protein
MANIVRANFAWYDAMIQAMTSSGGLLSTIVPGSANSIEIYSGTPPDDANSWVPGGGGSPVALLATFDTFMITQNDQSNYAVSVEEAVFKTDRAPDPGTLNATATGTAAWYAMFQPSAWSAEGVLIGSVSLSGGNGSLHLDSLDLVAGLPVQLLHWGLTFTHP